MQPLESVAGFEDLQKQMRKNRGVIEVTGTVPSEQAHLTAGLAREYNRILIVAENELNVKSV